MLTCFLSPTSRLLRRGLQTLWKPVPELIDILGVDVPAPPDVSLTAIGVDKATITWTRPPSNRAVDKYVIQVNGVNGMLRLRSSRFSNFSAGRSVDI